MTILRDPAFFLGNRCDGQEALESAFVSEEKLGFEPLFREKELEALVRAEFAHDRSYKNVFVLKLQEERKTEQNSP